ncbi:MAG: hypothetical protein FWB95_02510 [Treponema sp.]|nr:hypothetical protein [Treponema sp.]
MAEFSTTDTLPAGIVFGAKDLQEVMQNVRTIITTPKGTLPLDRNFGISFNFVDSPIHKAQAMAEQEIFMQLRKYEPRAILKQITWRADPLSGSFKPNVTVQVRL